MAWVHSGAQVSVRCAASKAPQVSVHCVNVAFLPHQLLLVRVAGFSGDFVRVADAHLKCSS
eukprot:2328420-Pleurochrysis_carterae.AAC.1